MEEEKDNLSQLPQQQSATTTPDAKSPMVSNESATIKDKKKLVRRAFSMPRNLFRLSRRVKVSSSASNDKNAVTNADTTNQSAETNRDEHKLNVENVENNKHRTLPVSSSSSTEPTNEQSKQQPHLADAKPQSEQDNKHRLFRRSTWKKFLLTRFILQTINLKVNWVFPPLHHFALSGSVLQVASYGLSSSPRRTNHLMQRIASLNLKCKCVLIESKNVVENTSGS